MNRILHSAALAALLAGASMLAMTGAVPASFAQEADDAIDTSEFSRAFVEHYQDAVDAFQDDMDMPAAHAALAEARAITDLSPGERYTLEILDFQLYLQEQNIEEAAARFNAAYDTGVMPQSDKENFLRIGALLNQQDYPRAIMYGSEAVNYPGWDDAGDQVLANAYYFSGDLAGAETFAESVIARKEAAGEMPTFEILNVLYYAEQEQGKETEAQETAGRIAVVQPTPENWSRVIDSAFTAPNLEDRHYLNLYRLRREAATMQPADYTGMAQIAVDLGLPAEAKSVLDEGIANGALQPSDLEGALADVNALTTETEASLPGFASEAAAAPTGQPQVQYGELLLTYGRAADAEAAIQSGIQKGGLTNPADAQILLGIAQLEQGKKAEALQSFQQAEQNALAQPVARAWRLYASI